jgi:hypothetical protein
LTEPVARKIETDYTFIDLEPTQLQSKAGLYTRVTERGLPQMITIAYTNGKLTELWGNQVPAGELSAVTSSHFITKLRNWIISLKFDEDGQGFEYQFHDDKPLHFTKSDTIRNVLSDYTGRYKNHSTGATIKVKKKGTKLVVHKGIIRIPMTNFAIDQFYAPGNDALFTFVRDEKGTVRSVRADASDFRNFWFEKQ